MGEAIGMRLLLDGFVSRQLMEDELRLLLPELARRIGMTPVGSPIFWPGEPHPWGTSAVQFIQESDILIHYMHVTQVAINIFSCKLFDQAKTVDLLLKAFHITAVSKQMVILHEFASEPVAVQ